MTCSGKQVCNKIKQYYLAFSMNEFQSIRDKIKDLSSSASNLQFSSVHSLCHVRRFVTPCIAAHLSITNSRSPPKPMSTESVMPSNHLILCCPFLLLPPIFPSIRVFPKESALRIRWPKYWSFSFNISPSSEHGRLQSMGSLRVGHN